MTKVAIIADRRTLGRAVAASLLAGLAGCGVVSTQTVNGVTTVLIDTAKMDSYAQGFINGGEDLISALPVNAGAISLINDVLGLISQDIKAFDVDANGQVSLTYDSTSVPAALSSLLKDAQTLLKDSTDALASVAAPQVAVAKGIVAALQTIVTVLGTTLGLTSAPLMGLPMSEAAALKVLRVH